MNIKIAIGANFGDEGKGLMTDYYCNQIGKCGEVLNVRFNGAAQAGHTVTTPEGKRVIFRSIGAGTLNNSYVNTYMNQSFIVDIPSITEELYALHSMNIVTNDIYVHEDARVSLPFDSMVNRLVERARGKDRHGSCGFGVWETVLRSRVKDVRLQIKDLKDPTKVKVVWDNIQKYYDQRLASLNLGTDINNDPFLVEFRTEEGMQRFMDLVERFLNRVRICDNNILHNFNNVVFEGAQGLMLDNDNREYFPNITPSYTGVRNVIDSLNMAGIIEENIEVCYVTRTYLTRHGVGMLKNECAKEDINGSMRDFTNEPNEFQGALRYGLLSVEDLVQYTNRDIGYISKDYCRSIQKSVCVTHLNETDGKVYTSTGKVKPEELAQQMGARLYVSDGHTRKSVKRV